MLVELLNTVCLPLEVELNLSRLLFLKFRLDEVTIRVLKQDHDDADIAAALIDPKKEAVRLLIHDGCVIKEDNAGKTLLHLTITTFVLMAELVTL